MDWDFTGIESDELEALIHLSMLEDTLEDYQREDIVNILSCFSQKNLLTHEMGLGKSYMIVSLATLYKLQQPNKKIIIAAPTESIKNLEELLTRNTPFRILRTSGDARKINKLKNTINDLDIILLQHSAIDSSLDLHLMLFNELSNISTVIVDEASMSDRAGYNSFLELMRKVKNVTLLNASLLEASGKVIYNCLYGTNVINMNFMKFRGKYCTYDSTSAKYIPNTFKIREEFNNIFNRNRNQTGIDIQIDMNFHRVYVNDWQKALLQDTSETRKVLTSPPMLEGFIQPKRDLTMTKSRVPALAKLFEIIKNNQDNGNIVIYVNYMTSVKRIKDELEYMGKKVFVITGANTSSPVEKMREAEAFNQSENVYCIISIEKAISLNSSKHMILYDIPKDISQTVFRIIRGKNHKAVKVDMIYYPEFNADLLYEKMIAIENGEQALGRKTGIPDALKEELNNLSS